MQRELTRLDDVERATASRLRTLIWLLWQLVRVPVYLVLAILEPFVSLALSLLVLIALFTAVVSGLLEHAPHFPLGLMIGFAFACAMLLGLYHGLMAFLAAR